MVALDYLTGQLQTRFRSDLDSKTSVFSLNDSTFTLNRPLEVDYNCFPENRQDTKLGLGTLSGCSKYTLGKSFYTSSYLSNLENAYLIQNANGSAINTNLTPDYFRGETLPTTFVGTPVYNANNRLIF